MKNVHPQDMSVTSLNDDQRRIVETLRTLRATSATMTAPSEKIERRSQLRHGPMMHHLRELERRDVVGRVVGRKDVLFFLR